MSTVDIVQEAVLKRMLRGELEPGSWIRQDELAARLGVSKIPVREALQRLIARGLLKAEPNRGVMVPRMSVAEAEESFGLRRAIEPELLRRAVPLISRVDLAQAQTARLSEGMTPTEANWAFHSALYRASGWDRGLALDEILHAAMAPYTLLYLEGLGGAWRSDRQHGELMEACQDRDGDRAVKVLVHHLDEAAEALVSFLTE